MQEAKELADDDSPDYAAAPLDDVRRRRLPPAESHRRPTLTLPYPPPPSQNLFEWHATIRGAPDTEFEGGSFTLILCAVDRRAREAAVLTLSTPLCVRPVPPADLAARDVPLLGTGHHAPEPQRPVRDQQEGARRPASCRRPVLACAPPSSPVPTSPRTTAPHPRSASTA